MRFFRKETTQAPAPDFVAGAGIAFKNVTFTDIEGQHTIINDFSVHITASSTAILGLNGSGKSSILKLINGINSPSSGTITVDGVPLTGNETAIRSRVGLLFSNPLAQLLMPTPAEDIELSLRTLVKDASTRKQRAMNLLAERGLEHRAHSSVYDLSGGEQQLVALTSVLAVEPRILLLDEPTTLLDLRNRLRLFEVLEHLPQQLLISTHDLDLARWCEQALVIHDGRLYAQGEAGTLVDLYQQWCAKDFPDEPLTTPVGRL